MIAASARDVPLSRLPWGPIFVKDLSRLGRDLDRTLIVDNVQENFMLQPNHGIFIFPWCAARLRRSRSFRLLGEWRSAGSFCFCSECSTWNLGCFG